MTSFKNSPLGSQSIAVRLLLREAPSRAEAAAAAAGIGEAGSWFMGSTAKAAGRIRGVELRRESAKGPYFNKRAMALETRELSL